MKSIIPLIFLMSSLQAANEREELVQGCHQKIIALAQTNKLLIFAPIERNDLPEELIDEPNRMIKKISEMESRGLLAGAATITPWSDSYWPIYRGGLGQRYNDPGFQAYEWKSARDYVVENPVASLIESGDFDKLSPSEKYDHLLGLTDFPFTSSQWKDGAEYFSRGGSVESWMGYCHGWAPASMMMPEPKKKVRIDKLTFFPSDIKGLATMLWAKGRFPTRFIGGRCNSENPSTDRNGRAREQSCLDNNPGSWHIVVVNQLGLSKRPFIMDASWDYQVWNHPVFSYQYSTFNPRTKRDGNFEASSVRPGSWDKRKEFRADGTMAIIGVRMTVNYAVENEPTVEEDQASDSSSATYEYDLELNAKGEIIGGEWISETHPDFLWVPAPGSAPKTPGDNMAVNLSHISSELRSAAKTGASKGIPSGSIVTELVRFSKGAVHENR